MFNGTGIQVLINDLTEYTDPTTELLNPAISMVWGDYVKGNVLFVRVNSHGDDVSLTDTQIEDIKERVSERLTEVGKRIAERAVNAQ